MLVAVRAGILAIPSSHMEKHPIGFVSTREEASHLLPTPALSFAVNCSIEAGQK